MFKVTDSLRLSLNSVMDSSHHMAWHIPFCEFSYFSTAPLWFFLTFCLVFWRWGRCPLSFLVCQHLRSVNTRKPWTKAWSALWRELLPHSRSSERRGWHSLRELMSPHWTGDAQSDSVVTTNQSPTPLLLFAGGDGIKMLGDLTGSKTAFYSLCISLLVLSVNCSLETHGRHFASQIHWKRRL